MGKAVMLHLVFGVLAVLGVSLVNAEDPYLYFTWTVTYGTRSVLGVPQKVILINNQIPGPKLDVVTNNTIILNVINKLDQPFSLIWNGMKQRKNYGVFGTNCPIPPNSNFTYKFQAKDQIGSNTYFPSTLIHRAAGGFGALNIYRRSLIPNPAGVFEFSVSAWFNETRQNIPEILINNRAQNIFSKEQGQTIEFKISNPLPHHLLHFTIENHALTKVLDGGYRTMENLRYVNVEAGDSVSVLVTLNQPQNDYLITTTFYGTDLKTTQVLRYKKSSLTGHSAAPASEFDWSFSFCLVLFSLLLDVN